MRGAMWDVIWRLGTPAVSLPLLGVAAAHVAASLLIDSHAVANAFATSAGSWAIAGALALDAAVAAMRAAPFAQARDGSLRWRLPDRGALAALLVAGGYLGMAIAFTVSLASRERIEVRCAVGEECSAAREQIVSRDPGRPFSAGAFPFRFTIEAAAVDGARGAGSAPDWIAVRAQGGERRRATRWTPLWFGWGRMVRPIGSGQVLRYELFGPQGETLESAFAKLEIDPPGRVDSIRAETLPHRIYVRARPGDGNGSDAPALDVAVYRGKLAVASATLRVGERLPFEGHSLAFPEWLPWVQLEVVHDPGIPLVALGALLAAAGLLLRRLR